MAPNTKYIIDSNILIESKNVDYGFDLCPGFWDAIEKGLKSGIIIMHDNILQELKRASEDEPIRQWLKKVSPTDAAKTTDEELELYVEFCRWAGSQDYKPAAVAKFEEPKYADPWICAKAKIMNLTLVTQEKSDPKSKKSIKIPDLCHVYDINYCNKYTLLRELKARFILE